jgi:hypothetical protein
MVDGWMVGWLDGWMVGWLDGWMVGWLDGWMVGKWTVNNMHMSLDVIDYWVFPLCTQAF